MPAYPVEFQTTPGIVWGYEYRRGDVTGELEPVCTDLLAHVERPGLMQIRSYTEVSGEWRDLIEVPEPSVGLSAILLFGVMLWGKWLKGE